MTRLHGDFTGVNVATGEHEVVLLDWALASAGPAVLDFVCFLVTCASHIDLGYPQLLDEVRTACGAWHDENVLRVALFWGLLELGWNKALDAAEHRDPDKRAAARSWPGGPIAPAMRWRPERSAEPIRRCGR